MRLDDQWQPYYQQQIYDHNQLTTARSCVDDPPNAWLGIDMDWPLKKKILGTVVTYNCPFRTKTNLEELAGEQFLNKGHFLYFLLGNNVGTLQMISFGNIVASISSSFCFLNTS